MRKLYFILPLAVAITFAACKKEKENVKVPTSQEMLTGFSGSVVLATYADLELKGDSLKSKVAALNANPSADKLTAARNAWKATREVWERSEAFLFGPTSDLNLDPGIDSWPVNQTDLDQLLATSDVFSDSYVDALTDDGLRGFHPLEYMLWGANGTKEYTDFTARENEYMVAMASYIERATNLIYDGWNPIYSSSYYWEVVSAGGTSTRYPTKVSAFEEIVNGMAGICDEVANGKMEEPYAAQDANLEESQFSHNSLTDFRNNIVSVKNAYLGGYNTENGSGLSKWVAANNASLDQRIKDKISASIAAIDAITGPFGTAASSGPNIQIEAAQDRINELETLITDELLPLVQSKIQ